MLNLDYMKYLFKSKKFLILFIFLAYLVFAIDNYYDYDLISGLMVSFTVLLTFVLPCLVFHYIHNKKAIDTYFSIPISRKELLISGITCIILVIYVPYVISTLIIGGFYIDTLKVIALMLPIVTMLVIVNTLLYTLANNQFDGIVMIGAYNLIPVFIYVVSSEFIDSYIVGYSSSAIKGILYLSPVGTSMYAYESLMEDGVIATIPAVFGLLFLVASSTILYRTFLDRKAERANTTSSKFFAYPFVIYAYTFICVMGISANYDSGKLTTFLMDNLVLYLIIFILFVVAHFVYMRKFYFSVKFPIYYIIICIICISFCNLAYQQDGFGLAYKYPAYDENTTCRFYYYENDSGEVTKWVRQQTEDNSNYVDVEINAIGALQENTIKIINDLRKELIDKTYQYKNKYEYTDHSLNLTLYHNSNEYEYDYYNYYSVHVVLSVDTLKQLAKDAWIDIRIYTDNGLYTLDADGNLNKTVEYLDPAYARDILVE